MRKFILFAAILFAGVSVVKAGEPITGTVELNLNLHPFQSIEIGGETGGTVDGLNGLVDGKVQLDYKTIDNYKDGVSRTIKDHIKVIAAGGYKVEVSSTENNLTSKTGGDELVASSITVTAVNGTNTSSTPDATFTPVPLSASGDVLITSKKGSGKNNTFDVTYTGNKDNFFNNYISETGVIAEYETTVTYTITAL